MKLLLSVAAFLCLTQTISAQKIDPSASKITFTIANMGSTVEGTILNIMGTVNFDANDLAASNFEATADPSTVSTKSKGRDNHLKKDDFFGISTFPTIKMVSKSIKKTEQGYEATAILTIRDISQEVQIPFTVEEKDGQKILMGDLSVARKEYALGNKIGKAMIGLDANVHIHCVVE